MIEIHHAEPIGFLATLPDHLADGIVTYARKRTRSGEAWPWAKRVAIEARRVLRPLGRLVVLCDWTMTRPAGAVLGAYGPTDRVLVLPVLHGIGLSLDVVADVIEAGVEPGGCVVDFMAGKGEIADVALQHRRHVILAEGDPVRFRSLVERLVPAANDNEKKPTPLRDAG